MKLLSFELQGQPRVGLVKEAGVIDLTQRMGSHITTLRDVLRHDALDQVRRLMQSTSPDHALTSLRYACPIPFPEKIICVGVNYAHRNAEYKDGSDLPKYPSIFLRFPGSFVGHGEPLIRPPESQQLDYEGEIAIIIGKAGRRIRAEQAHQHIAGLTCMNEGTIRDWLRHGKFNVTQGKNFDRTGAMGPWMVSADAFADFNQLSICTRVNGETRQEDNTKNLMFPFAELIRYISSWTTLQPGDVIATGTPIGAGVRFDPPRFLKAGDRVDVEVGGVGVLSNPVADESSASPTEPG